MKYKLLEKFIKEYLNLFKGNIRFTWHGGEPLLAGIEFFQKVINLEKKYKRKDHEILNTIQTNGTLINNKWASFFKKNNFRIGVSLDGIEECHNIHRKTRSGKGSFRNTVRGIKKLKEYNVPVSILSVITRSSLPYIEKNLSFFVNDLKVKSIALLPYSPQENKFMKKETLSNEDIEELYRRAINFWLNTDDAHFKIREIDNFIAGALKKQATLCSFGGTCTGFFCLDYDGKIYPCDRLSSDPRFCWGDLSAQPLIEILNSKKRLEYANSVNNLPNDCKKCRWRNACHNGCFALRQKKWKISVL